MRPLLLAFAVLVAACGADGHGDETTLAVTDSGVLEVGIGDSVRYGDSPQQVGSLRLPIDAGEGPFPVIAFIHGGFWRNTFDSSLSEPQAADARSKGYATWNITYRRVGDEGGGYPGTLDDIATAIDALARIDALLQLGMGNVAGNNHRSCEVHTCFYRML